jgi:hypothetical protein
VHSKNVHYYYYYSHAVVEGNLAALHHVDKTAGRGHQQVAASVKVTHLSAYVGTTVHHARTEA